MKQVPEPVELREKIRAAAEARVAQLDRSQPLLRQRIDALSREVLAALDLPDSYLGWTMVVLSSAYWRTRIEATPYARRLLLLPHCMRNEEVCPADYNEFGLLCEDCGACSLTQWRALGREKGYQVLIAEGSPVVLQLILQGKADAVLGIGCLNSLEKALDKILMTGLPAMAVPLHSAACHNTSTDEAWALAMIDTPYRPGHSPARTQVHLLRAAARMFEPEQLARLLPAERADGHAGRQAEAEPHASLPPIASTEIVAREFLARGGKYFRPFITLATYDALTGGRGWGPDGGRFLQTLPDSIRRVALAIELFHKASLVHDDIEDDDAFRYGKPTVHRCHGAATAINVGDYLIGLGYRLVASQRAQLGADAVADILAALAQAHTRLCEGQGAELSWRAGPRSALAPLDALQIYALKTAPAFEAALLAGIHLATPAEPYLQAASRFSRHLGVAFQIRNDLDDWTDDPANKQHRGSDVVGARPTVLWALAFEAADPAQQGTLLSPSSSESCADPHHLRRVHDLYCRTGAFSKARRLVQKHADRARAVADTVQPETFRQLLHYFVDTILGY
ncbi:MAG: polyprenyl synthetase family protein [Thermoguttaceae bacterium]